MSFRERLARNFADAQQATDAQRQQVVNAWVTKIKNHFVKHCEAASHHQRSSFKMDVARPAHLTQLGVSEDTLLQKLQEMLLELDFRHEREGRVTPFQKVWRRQGDRWVDVHSAEVHVAQTEKNNVPQMDA